MAALHAALRAGADVNEREVWGETALHTAVKRSLLEAVDALLAAGADANALDELERTPLHWLGLCSPTEGTAAEFVRLLVRAGADLNAEDKHGEAPIHTVVKHGGGLEAVTALLDAGVSLHSRVNVDYVKNVMDCAIHSHSSASRVAVVRELLARGAMWSRPRADHLYALAQSIRRDDAAIAQILLDHGQPGDRVVDDTVAPTTTKAMRQAWP